jgi:AmmeMemoRadiSam system protein B
MSLERPRLRRLENFPVNQSTGEVLFALRDPEGFGNSVVLPHTAALLASLMDGSRTVAELADHFEERTRQPVDLEDIEQLVRDLDDRLLLDSPRYRARWKQEMEIFLNSKTRLAVHAGKAYPADAQALRAELSALFTAGQGPGTPRLSPTDGTATSGLVGILCPHIDLHRGGTTFAWSYKRLVEESDADLFVIFGTAHAPMSNLFCVTRKDFETPLGTVETDRQLAARLTANLAATPGGTEINLSADELVHRYEHSLEFQMVFLQFLLGEHRPFKVLPVLVGSFHDFIREGTKPMDIHAVRAFVAAMRKSVEVYGKRVCYIASGDLAHIGQRFGDRSLLNASRLQRLAVDDQALLEATCRPDANLMFEQVAKDNDANRVCGASPLYTMLEVARPKRGEILKYDQAVELDGTACVSFASAAFYDH